MEITITTKNENALLGRTEIKGIISFTGATPPYPQIQQSLAAQLKIKDDVIVIKHVLTQFGATKANLDVYIYQNVEQLKKIEPPIKDKKAKKTEEKKPEEKK